MTDLNDILNQDEAMNNEELMRYLEGNASAAERFAIEKQMASSGFVNDAVEGLQSFSTSHRMKQYAEQLNRQLHQQTSTSQRRRNKRELKDQRWTLIAIIVILTLCLLGYVAIHLYNKKHHTGFLSPIENIR
jgi:ferric-dicitrate binding protein FerR (iron transport regulator)